MIVVLRALGLGDLLAGVPALRALRRARADDELVLAAPAWLHELARHATGVDRCVDVDGLDAPLPAALAGARLAVNLHGRGPQSTALLRETGPERLVAFGLDGVAWRADEHERDRWCRLLVESGVAGWADPADLRVDPPGRLPDDGPWRDAVVLHPGASAPSRRWPVDRWAAVAAQAGAAGWPVAVTGSRAEAPLARTVAVRARLSEDAVLAGRTDVLGLLDVAAGAAAIVTGDTGMAHVASAVGAPSVVLFGPTPPSWWGPPSSGPHVVLWAGRRGDPHGSAPDAGLLAIGVDEVVAALASCAPVRAGVGGNR